MVKGLGMTKLCHDLIKSGFDLSQKDALEMFGRKGDWHTVDYSRMVKSLEVWEIDAQYNDDLRKNLPLAVIKNVDSIEFSRAPENRGRFDFIVIDNPMSNYGPNGKYSEHFDVIESACAMVRHNGVLVFNVNVQPYDYDNHPAWKKRREKFYGKADASCLSLDELVDFYAELFASSQLRVVHTVHYERNDFLYYLMFRLQKTTAPLQMVE